MKPTWQDHVSTASTVASEIALLFEVAETHLHLRLVHEMSLKFLRIAQCWYSRASSLSLLSIRGFSTEAEIGGRVYQFLSEMRLAKTSLPCMVC
jgi:hypothetical protein